jgi:hypothetical protein
MGMIGCFAAIDAKTLAAIQEDPSLMEDFLYPDDGDSEPENSLDVDKAWHAIHYMLNGTADGGDGPLALTVLGGEELGDDMGMGPARFLTPAQVKSVADALGKLTAEDFSGRFNPREMTELQIYPDVIWERDGQEGLDYVVHYFQQLVQHYQGAAERGDGMILSIC